ncbi:hypothetical protein Tco_1203383 [Tanacetum coccineum]
MAKGWRSWWGLVEEGVEFGTALGGMVSIVMGRNNVICMVCWEKVEGRDWWGVVWWLYLMRVVSGGEICSNGPVFGVRERRDWTGGARWVFCDVVFVFWVCVAGRGSGGVGNGRVRVNVFYVVVRFGGVEEIPMVMVVVVVGVVLVER